jgi:hypothetical protein
MTACKHRWKMADIRHGYLVFEGCPKCGGRSAFFSEEVVAPVDEYQEGDHSWVHLGSSQAVKFNLKCEHCGRWVDLKEVMGLMMSTCEDPECEVAKIRKEGGRGTWVYVAFCSDSTHASGKCISPEGIKALNEYFNQDIKVPGKKIVVVPCRTCCSIDRCRGIVIADAGLTEIY